MSWSGISLLGPKRGPRWVGEGTAFLLIVAVVLVHVTWAGRFALPIGYGVPIVLIGMFRRRGLLWICIGAFVVINGIKFFVLLPEKPSPVHLSQTEYDWLEGGMVLLDLVLVGIMVDLGIVASNWLEAQRISLEQTNSDLVAREEEIARQNEELQSQTEELERQSEELRVANEDLAHRERTLEILLSLSRSLGTELSTDEVMGRICETLGLLINGPSTAAAIVEQRDNRIVVRCHHGFGPPGVAESSVPLGESFASLVLSKGRTGYLEDIALRPDLRILQPKEGPPMVAILATPLRVRGVPIGSLEVYHREKTSWNQEQVTLIESLAAQTSVSLEAAQLFQTVSDERNRFEAVLRAAPVGIAVCAPDGTSLRLNPAGAAMLQMPTDRNITGETERRPRGTFRHGRALDPHDLPLFRAATSGEEVDAEELEVTLGSGRRINVLTYARPIRDGAGKLQGAVSVFIDITAQKELQRELDVRRREAEEASVRKTRFLAAVSHDIRTPANAISLLAELIRRTASNPAMLNDVPDLAQELHASASSLVNLLSDVLDIARFDSDRIELQETEFSLSGFLADEHRQLLPLARQKALALQFNNPADPLVLRTDRIKLSRILGNLVGNAIKFTDSGGVRVDAHLNGEGSVRITVTDTGIGIAAEHLEHIFDEFFQLRNPERDRTKGTGLGLTICKRLVDAMGGTISVQSTPGAGSTFTVTLPPFALLPRRPRIG